MICANCKVRDTTIEHVKNCCASSAAWNTVPRQPVKAAPFTLSAADKIGLDIEGVYQAYNPEATDEIAPSYYRVKRSQNGHHYASAWDGEWKYLGRYPLRWLTTEDVVTAEQAAQFGKAWGQCVFCSRTLTDDRSVEVGYGPICADKNGLPWGTLETNRVEENV